ncbi:epidermal growth factor-like protein [Culex pipiens pallens]|uniref:epidermal growth factor-like protein n=1 Tax=Culex pipiens pallens TaxID=42434 RepID=UPI0022AAACE8|nr:epidermal growth factor-like protein [Culex pipiens pallens]
MRTLIAVNVALVILPLIAAQNCVRDISVPSLVTTTKRVSRTYHCNYDCVFSYTEYVDTSYIDYDGCWLNYEVKQESVCCEGYKQDSLGQCKPICVGCSNGRCTEPNVCSCYAGYQDQMGICVPVCEPKCGHGTCVAPGRCSCHEGYVMDAQKGCVPVCDPPCQNGACTGVNTCECFSGFQQVQTDSNVCAPECDLEIADCGNGTCVEPNRCRCAEGFTFEDNRCIAHCDRACSNGSCTSPNTCTCNAGYVNNPAVPGECIPFCDGGCQNGTCVAPNTCECLGGFEQSNHDANLCEPSCDPKFMDPRKGECIAPNVLDCNAGYVLEYSSISGRTFCKRALDLEWGHSTIGNSK